MTHQELNKEIARTEAIFEEYQAKRIDVPTLLPAGQMLDLYGEEIRERAYIVHDPLDGDWVLRPDFTVPVVNQHIAQNLTSPAIYSYSGRVWRRRRETMRTEKSFWQLGFEILGSHHILKDEAHILELAFHIQPHMQYIIGDVGVMLSLLDEIELADFQRSSLKRHFWNADGFAQWLDYLSTPPAPPPNREISAPVIGKRSTQEIEKRINALYDRQSIAPISQAKRTLIEELLMLEGHFEEAVDKLSQFSQKHKILENAVKRIEERLQYFFKVDIPTKTLQFQTRFGQERMEYYDGFVFAAYGEHAKAPIITGGRYDRLAEEMTQAALPAIGLSYRPELALKERVHDA